ncbi:unnamed protein product [Amoebophrya sp. A25]|nr:unnamed protein product [Amoebophrya sp. A25]|eukprot:GSA25T00023453001.1
MKAAPEKKAVRGYAPPPEVNNSLDNKYYAQVYHGQRVVSNCDHSLGERRDPPTYAMAERGPRLFSKPLVPTSDPMWPKNFDASGAPAAHLYKEDVVSDTILDKYSTFEEWKNTRNFEDYYPGLFKAPHKVYPGRQFGTAAGSFDWWRSKPEFDWWNVSNQQRQTFFRNEAHNEMGDPVGPRIPPSREVCRVPPTDGPEWSARRRACSEDRQSKVAIYATPAVSQGYWPLVRKYCAPIPRYPLEKNANDQLVPRFGRFDSTPASMRGQVADGFCRTGSVGSANKSARSSTATPRSGGASARSGSSLGGMYKSTSARSLNN